MGLCGSIEGKYRKNKTEDGEEGKREEEEGKIEEEEKKSEEEEKKSEEEEKKSEEEEKNKNKKKRKKKDRKKGKKLNQSKDISEKKSNENDIPQKYEVFNNTTPVIINLCPSIDPQAIEQPTGKYDKDKDKIKPKIDTPPVVIIPKPNIIIPTYYDAIYRCESCQELFKKGWNYFLTEKFLERMKDSKNKICPMCVLGETNKGKTFLVNILTGKKLKAGIEYKTEGMSCKFSDFKYSYDKIDEINESQKPEKNKFLIFDTAGRSEPLLIDKTNEEERKDLKKIVEANYRDLKISEEFLKNLLINNSQIILVVVNQLSLAEQIFLYQLKNQRNFDQLFIIHNLFNFETREDLEDYIENTIVRSIYFDISKHYYDIENESQNNINRPYYPILGIIVFCREPG